MATGATLQRIVKARDLLHAELQRGPTLDELADATGLSRAHLAREFADTFGVPPHQYLVACGWRTPSACSRRAAA